MLKKEIKTGGIYHAKVTGQIVEVQILGENRFGGWHAKNLRTGRTIRIKSAAKLRSEVRSEDVHDHISNVLSGGR